MDVNSLPKTVTRQRHKCDLNPGPTAPESSTLTTRLPSHPVQPCGHCNWQISSIFIAMLWMYRARQPTNNCHQTASNCTKSYTEFQKFPGGYTRTFIGWGLGHQIPVPDWRSEKVATQSTAYTQTDPVETSIKPGRSLITTTALFTREFLNHGIFIWLLVNGVL